MTELDDSKEALRQHLARFEQDHLLTFWDELSAPQRQKLTAQLLSIDPQQLSTLVNSASSPENWALLARRAEAPTAFRLHDKRASLTPAQAVERGNQALAAGQVGVILVAGGQGTRLGLDHPKGMFSIGPVSGASLFRILLEKILARSRACGKPIPLYLMTSPATHEETIAYLRENNYFGLPRDDVKIFCQGTMPAVDAETGRMLLAEKDELAVSPDGHGGMLRAMVMNNCFTDIRRRELRELFYCQVDNPLVEMCDPEFLGYHLLTDSELSTQVVAKQTSRDRVGNVVSVDGQLRIIEYSDLNPLGDELVERKAPDGTPIFWAGNTAIHVMDVPFLERIGKSGTALPFHVAKKAVSYLDSSGTKVEPEQPNAIKFERFIFDLLPEARHAIVMEVDERQAFAPVKNAPGEERDTPESVQACMIALHTQWLRAAGCQVAPGVAVEISPLFAQNAQETAARVQAGMAVTEPRYFC